MYADNSFILKKEVPLPFEILICKRCCGGSDAFFDIVSSGNPLMVARQSFYSVPREVF